MSIDNPEKSNEFKKEDDKKNQENLIVLPETIKNKLDKYEEALADLKILLDMDNEEVKEKIVKAFIEKRLKELEKEATNKKGVLSLVGNCAVGEFIDPETEIKRAYYLDGFHINDPEIYNVLLTTFAKFYKAWNKPQMNVLLGHSIIYALGNYFGNHYSTENSEKRNVNFYSDHSDLDSKTINLSELKGKNFAVCAEKASVAHNYLKFLGIDSHIIFSNNCRLDEETPGNGHAYIILETKKGKFIFDPTNPIVIKNTEDVIISLEPSLYKISDEDYKHLLNRDKQRISVQHSNKIFDNGNYTSEEAKTRFYG